MSFTESFMRKRIYTILLTIILSTAIMYPMEYSLENNSCDSRSTMKAIKKEDNSTEFFQELFLPDIPTMQCNNNHLPSIWEESYLWDQLPYSLPATYTEVKQENNSIEFFQKPFHLIEITRMITATYTNHFIAHKRKHTKKQRPYACIIEGCKESFFFEISLEYHIKTHTEKKLYACTVAGCNRAFFCYNSLMYHMRIHTQEW